VLHDFLDLGVSVAAARHCDELFRPEFAEVGNLARGHDDSTDENNSVVLQKLMLLQAQVFEDLDVVGENVGLGQRGLLGGPVDHFDPV